MRIFVGDDTGLLKHYCPDTKSIVSIWGSQSKPRAIKDLAFCSEDESEIAVSYKGLAEIDILNATTGETNFNLPGVRGPTVGLFAVNKEETRTVVTCSPTGLVQYHTYSLASAGNQQSAAKKSKAKLIKVKSEVDVGSIEVRGPVARMRPNASKTEFAVGGNENDLEIWDVETCKSAFKAKNVPDDFLRMRVPVHILDEAFFSNPNRIATATAYRQVRIYDRKAGKRPVVSIEHEDSPLSRIILSHDENYAVVADNSGCIYNFDLRTNRLFGKYRGGLGAVQDMAIHPTLPILAAVSLDRHMRIYNADTRKITHRVYLKQQLNSVLFSKDLSLEAIKQEQQEKEFDEVFGEEEEEETPAEKPTAKLAVVVKTEKKEKEGKSKKAEKKPAVPEKPEEVQEESDNTEDVQELPQPEEEKGSGKRKRSTSLKTLAQKLKKKKGD